MQNDQLKKENEKVDLEQGGIVVSLEQKKQNQPLDIGSTDALYQVNDPIAQKQGDPSDVQRDDVETRYVRERNVINRSERVYVTLPGSSAATAANYGVVFYAIDPCFVRRVIEVHQTKGTDGSAVGLNVEKLTGTQALDAGTALLSSNLNLKGNDNTAQQGVFVTNRGARTLSPGDRLALKDSGTLTSLAGVFVIIEVEYL